MFKFKSKFTGILVAALTLTACGNTKDEKNTDELTDSLAASIIQNLPPTITDNETKPEECVIVFDASSSMRGYVDATVNGAFPGAISTLNNAGDKSHAYLFDYKKTSIDNFLSKIQNKNITWAAESDLFGMVKEILNSAAANTQNCYALVTDGIMSGTNTEIKADPTYNISKPDILKGKIDSIVSHMPTDKEISLLVVAFKAPFNGKYYKYNNDSVRLENAQRPFYVLVVGGIDQINYMRKKLSDLTYEKMVHYGVVYPMAITCNGKIAGKKYKLNKSMKEEGVKLELAMDKLPSFAQNIDYLNNNLEIIMINSKGNKTMLAPAIGDNEGNYTIEINGCKATITLDKKFIYAIPATFRFNLKRAQPQWIKNMTTHDDIKDYRADATLNLDYFLEPFVGMNNAVYLNDTTKSKIEIIKPQ